MEGLTLSPAQFDTVYNALSLCVAGMGAGFVFFISARKQVAAPYRPALLVSALVVGIACYHYLRIFQSFGGAFTLTDGLYVQTAPFNDAYRYADWLLTVPLLLIEVVAVLGLTRAISGPMFAKLTIASVLMLVTGYPGEITDDTTTRAIWGAISTVPFLYILYVLWVELDKSMGQQPPKVRVLMRNLRLLILGSWGVYPIAYMLPMFDISGSSAAVGVQVGYTFADLVAKPGMGLLIYHIARAKSIADASAGKVEDDDTKAMLAHAA